MKKQPESMKEFLEGLKEILMQHASKETQIHMRYIDYLNKMENFHKKFPMVIPYFTVLHDYTESENKDAPSKLMVVTSGKEVDDHLEELLTDMLTSIKEGQMQSKTINDDTDSQGTTKQSGVDPKKNPGAN